jgi:hypothetical protein
LALMNPEYADKLRVLKAEMKKNLKEEGFTNK